MDVRYGEGAFLQSLPKARRVFAMIQTILNEWQIETDGLYTETSWPTGSTIGNAVEVAEAVDVMRPTPSGQYIARRVNEQWCLVKSFFANLCRNGLPGNQHVDYDGMAEELRASGEVLRAFRNLLTTHGVGDQVAGTLVREPESLLLAGMANLDLRSGKEGRIKYCDQRTLGATVNFALGSGGTDYGGRKAPGGVVLRKDLGSEVARGDVLMTICVPEQLSDEQRDGIASRLLKCFCIE
jgi:thymidine phosphorylase